MGAKAVPSPDGGHIAILAFKVNNNVWMVQGLSTYTQSGIIIVDYEQYR